jgi:hypothetical protein
MAKKKSSLAVLSLRIQKRRDDLGLFCFIVIEISEGGKRFGAAFTLTAVLTLALGIGATTAIFTLAQQVMLQSLPVSRPDQLWRIGDQRMPKISPAGHPASCL